MVRTLAAGLPAPVQVADLTSTTNHEETELAPAPAGKTLYRETPAPPHLVGCPVDGRFLLVNSLGEVVTGEGDRTTAYDGIGSIDLVELCTRNKLVFHNHPEWREDPNHPINLFVKAEGHRKLYLLTEGKTERAAVLAVWAMQEKVNTGRWRVYGGVANGKPYAILVTEFINWVEGADRFWLDLLRGVERATPAMTGYVRTMREAPHVDRYWPPKGVEGERVTDQPVGGRDDGAKFAAGPNDGRPERQVEAVWPVWGRTPQEVADLVTALSGQTQKLWDEAGVGVC